MSSRRSRGWEMVGRAALLAGVAGCTEPQDIVPVAPPGLEIQRVPAVAVGEPQAIGETGTSTPQQASPSIASEAAPLALPTPVGQPTKTASGLEYVTLKEGDGEPVKPGQALLIHYVGTLTDGTKFDSSRDRNEPFSVTIGRTSLIRGWTEGIPGMRLGERRKLTIPPELAYGAQAQKGIPANSTLNFEVELLSAK